MKTIGFSRFLPGVALALAALLAVLIRTVQQIDRSAGTLLEAAGKVAANTANIPQAVTIITIELTTAAVVAWPTAAELLPHSKP